MDGWYWMCNLWVYMLMYFDWSSYGGGELIEWNECY